MYFLSVILIGTIYPIFLEVISNERISVGPPFYNKLLIPFLIPFLIFMAIGPNTKWIKSNLNLKNIKLILPFFLSIIISYIIINKIELQGLFSIILIIVGFYLFLITLKDFFLKSQTNLSQKVSHFGFSLFILSIVFNGILSKEVTINLKVGDKYLFKDEIIFFKKIDQFEKENYKSIIGSFEIQDKNKKKIYLKPELRIYNQPVVLTSEADIKTSLFSDKFLVMNLVNDENFYNIRYQTKPFMIWIWLSTILLALGALLNFINREKK
jgi:cytochrome c-type biogenesis protein CcmF